MPPSAGATGWRMTKAYCHIRDTLRVMLRVGDVSQSCARVMYRSGVEDMAVQMPPAGVTSGSQVWRSVHCRLLDKYRRDWLFRIAHNAIVTNLKRLLWRLGDGMYPRTGCTRWETMPHVFWQCEFVSLLWEWFQVLTDRLTCVDT